MIRRLLRGLLSRLERPQFVVILYDIEDVSDVAHNAGPVHMGKKYVSRDVLYAFYAEHWHADGAAEALPYGAANIRVFAVADNGTGRLHVETP